MEIERLKKSHATKVVLYLGGLILVVFAVVTLQSKAKYRVTQSIKIVDGEVNYQVPDLNLISLNVETSAGSGSFTKTDVPPTGNYEINTDRTYCTVGSNTTQLKNIPIEYKDSKLYIGINDKNTKCYVWINKQELLVDKFKDKVNSTSEGCPNYEDAPSVTSAKTSGSLFCKGKDDFGDTYYFRGDPTNNWVKIGNFYWRIIRFNGNGSIRLIYSGSGSAQTSGAGTQTKTLAYNTQYNNAQYVKYVYGSTDSTIKADLDSWYTINLKSTYGSKMDGSVGFCNDADMTNSTDFKPYTRIETNKKPTFKCGTPTTNLYTTSGGTKGNQKLTNPIGLITLDEANFAGGLWNTGNSGYYLYTNQYYWTMSPYYFYCCPSIARVFFVTSDGSLRANDPVETVTGVRPVINLRSDTLFKGKGTQDSPYVVVI